MSLNCMVSGTTFVDVCKSVNKFLSPSCFLPQKILDFCTSVYVHKSFLVKQLSTILY